MGRTRRVIVCGFFCERVCDAGYEGVFIGRWGWGDGKGALVILGSCKGREPKGLG